MTLLPADGERLLGRITSEPAVMRLEQHHFNAAP